MTKAFCGILKEDIHKVSISISCKCWLDQSKKYLLYFRNFLLGISNSDLFTIPLELLVSPQIESS